MKRFNFIRLTSFSFFMVDKFQMVILYQQTVFKRWSFYIFKIQIQLIIKFGTAMSINMHLFVQIPPHNPNF